MINEIKEDQNWFMWNVELSSYHASRRMCFWVNNSLPLDDFNEILEE